MPGLTTLRRHEDAIHAIVRPDIYGGVALRQMADKPRDLQSIVANDVILRVDIAQPNRACAGKKTQRVPVDSIGLAAPAVERPLHAHDTLELESIQFLSLEFRNRSTCSIPALDSLSPRSSALIIAM